MVFWKKLKEWGKHQNKNYVSETPKFLIMREKKDAGVLKLVSKTTLKVVGPCALAGSIPVSGTKKKHNLREV